MEHQLGADESVAVGRGEAEAQTLTNSLHGAVLGEDVGRDPRQVLVAADLDQPAEQLGPQAEPLGPVGDQEPELGVARAP